jgi:hypothetical protein
MPTPRPGVRRYAGCPVLSHRYSPAYRAAYRCSWLALVAQHGQPAKGSAVALAMDRCSVAGAHLALTSEAWARLQGRQRHTKDSRAELRAAVKAMERAGEAYTRALADLRAVVPSMPPVPLTKAEREKAAYDARLAKLTAEKALEAAGAGGDKAPRPILPATGRDEVAQGGFRGAAGG